MHVPLTDSHDSPMTVRAPIVPSAENLYFVGDAARVVEPFTGEGIFYALASGELAATHIFSAIKNGAKNHRSFAREHAALYAILCCVAIIAVFAPLATARYRRVASK